MKKIVAVFFALFVVSAANVWAQEDVEAQFKALDADGSGTLSMEEAEADADLEAVFAELDTDGNGELSFEEFSAFYG